jgi:predicted transcriptional regulator
MAATSLKLPEGLKRRIERLAGAANKTPHAFMVEALSQEADRAEIRERFAKDAAKTRHLARRCVPSLHYVAPHTAKIHTLITLGISIRRKPLVL